MKQVKLYNVIFPIWFLLFFPPVIFFTLAGNFVIDSVVVLICFFIFKVSKTSLELKAFYLKNILKVWLYGFLADFIGALVLFTVSVSSDLIKLPNGIISGINFDPYKHPLAVLIILIAMLISALFIFIFNYKSTFRDIADKKLRFKLALTIAIVTMPWTFLLPTKWFYHDGLS
jgi:hypothetical protein